MSVQHFWKEVTEGFPQQSEQVDEDATLLCNALRLLVLCIPLWFLVNWNTFGMSSLSWGGILTADMGKEVNVFDRIDKLAEVAIVCGAGFQLEPNI